MVILCLHTIFCERITFIVSCIKKDNFRWFKMSFNETFFLSFFTQATKKVFSSPNFLYEHRISRYTSEIFVLKFFDILQYIENIFSIMGASKPTSQNIMSTQIHTIFTGAPGTAPQRVNHIKFGIFIFFFNIGYKINMITKLKCRSPKIMVGYHSRLLKNLQVWPHHNISPKYHENT